MPHQTMKLFVIDAEELSRTGFCLLFAKDERISIVGSANSIENARAELEEAAPDVLVIKADLSTHNLVDETRNLKMEFPQVRILLLLETMEASVVSAMIQNNVSGMCSVQSNVEDVFTATHAVARGCMWFDPQVSRVVKLLLQASSAVAQPPEGQPRLLTACLTERENEILQLMTRRMSNQQIAEQLHLSVETVKTYIRRIMDKSAIRNRRDLLSTLENPPHRAQFDHMPDKG